MSTNAKKTTANFIPTLRYRDAPGAIDWLCKAFDFERRFVVPGDGEAIAHAQLTFGTGMIMLASIGDSEFDSLQKSPDDLGGAVTQSVYVIVDDMDAHYARAQSAGANIVMKLVQQDYGGSGYSCRDPEGNLWSFGSYDPWASAE